MPNEFNQDIPAAVLEEVQGHLAAIKAKLGPYLLPLTPAERKALPRMGDKTVAFVQKASDYATNNPAFVPAFVDLKELKQDLAGVTALTPLRQQVQQLATDLDSTIMVGGSEAYTNGLTIFTNIKYLAKNRQPGAQAAYDDLGVRFPGRPKKGKDDPQDDAK